LSGEIRTNWQIYASTEHFFVLKDISKEESVFIIYKKTPQGEKILVDLGKVIVVEKRNSPWKIKTYRDDFVAMVRIPTGEGGWLGIPGYRVEFVSPLELPKLSVDEQKELRSIPEWPFVKKAYIFLYQGLPVLDAHGYLVFYDNYFKTIFAYLRTSSGKKVVVKKKKQEIDFWFEMSEDLFKEEFERILLDEGDFFVTENFHGYRVQRILSLEDITDEFVKKYTEIIINVFYQQKFIGKEE